ncbi:hypothetical protein MT899_004861 [Salmonella enterica subsp. enterica]|nr:hypothetical protein [Salmonella enterica subsp. enterica]EKM5283456.1 hypothetical protein [Salmonella enterica]EDX0905048.1 hypothetical protein [Salmonella enterica subsp. enterica]EEG5393626.1 hypothetical protein [Salmonella enterica subsp. enterica]EEG5547105.1 hypothetical protein [Salmonella enterica subsp. enterica]
MNEDEKIISLLKDVITALDGISSPRVVDTKNDIYNSRVQDFVEQIKEKSVQKYPEPYIKTDC